MSDRPPRSIIPRQGGFFDELGMRVKLILRLMADRRVNPLLKLLPVGSVLYLLMPDLAPGPIDDAAVIWLGAYLFVELCPPDVVEQHLFELNSVVEGTWKEAPDESEDDSLSAPD